MPIRRGHLQHHERGDNYWSVWAGESLHDKEFIEQALHEEVVIKPSDERKYAYCTTS